MSDPPPRQIAKVYAFPNGMLMVFDQCGEQMPEYQGDHAEAWPRILRDAPPDTAMTLNARWRP